MLILDKESQHFGLSETMLIPIAARSIDDITHYIGNITKKIISRSGRINAMAVSAYNWPVEKEEDIPLWSEVNSGFYEQQLHPEIQIWVHVDYTSYRKAYMKLCDKKIPDGFFLDHIQNREAIRIREYSHPYLRLCPVSRRVNTSSGTNTGGEGMEKEYLLSMKKNKQKWKDYLNSLDYGIVYADPIDLTKMLNIAPETKVLAGAGNAMKLFYYMK